MKACILVCAESPALRTVPGTAYTSTLEIVLQSVDKYFFHPVISSSFKLEVIITLFSSFHNLNDLSPKQHYFSLRLLTCGQNRLLNILVFGAHFCLSRFLLVFPSHPQLSISYIFEIPETLCCISSALICTKLPSSYSPPPLVAQMVKYLPTKQKETLV